MEPKSMEIAETRPSGYTLGPPWLFRGSAFYQLHLVKAEVARAFIPREFNIVEAFGYTLGGFFLAHYDDSPAGEFDELVVIAGTVWNPPTSCAWAARVLVNSHEACRHGLKEIGLPSHVAIFSKGALRTVEKPSTKCGGFLNTIGMDSEAKEHTEIQVSEVNGSSHMSLCNIRLPYVVPQSISNKMWMSPTIRISLPSFSGHTVHHPHLLKYSCQIECRVRAVETAKVSQAPEDSTETTKDNSDGCCNSQNPNDCDLDDGLSAAGRWKQSISVLLSKPILALEFNFLKMQVEAPKVVVPHSKKIQKWRLRTG